MAAIVIIEHAMQQGMREDYIVYSLAKHWQRHGHTVKKHWGCKSAPPADVAILNVDVTVVPEEYQRLVASYPKVINGRAIDVSKRFFSRLLVTRDSGYEGPVIIKTNANAGGRVDNYLRRKAERTGKQCGIPLSPTLKEYPVLASIREVQENIWADPGYVVERFVPEQDERGYYSRHWLFFGDRERSVRYRAAVPVIKSHHMIDREAVDVPEEIRQWRSALGLDFGKLDYVLHDGRYELLDVNRTPTTAAQRGADLEARHEHLAQGLQGYL